MTDHAQPLWELARRQLSDADAAKVREHLSRCSECSARWEKVQTAVRVAVPAAVPPLSAEQWRNLDQKVLAMAQPPRSIFRWDWAQGWKLALPAMGGGLVAAAMVAWLAVRAPKPVGETRRPELSVAVDPRPAAEEAAVVSVRDGNLDRGARAARGSVLRTRAGGELWFNLPEHSRAGILGDSQVTLSELAVDDLVLTLDRGSLAVEAVHRTGRRFSVRAAGVEVQVVGTRFLVDRTEGQVVIAVEEGTVEVRFEGNVTAVSAGQRLAVQTSKPPSLTPPPQPSARPRPKRGTAAGVDGGSKKALSGSAETAEPLAEPSQPATVGRDLAEPGESESSSSTVQAPLTPPPPPPPVVREEGSSAPGWTFFRQQAELLARQAVDTARAAAAGLEGKARELKELADQGACDVVIERANTLLREHPSQGTDGGFIGEPYRTVFIQQARCLRGKGRVEEAQRVLERLKGDP